ncbi:uncharacterized protein Tco025E_00299 [Trypanosoma conorhini]|uniref:Uncharacterized protein n=1 Tax=Trypanosoma conorhini TaxID=83891 RepID=A0A422QBU9_9TRYP|nr:uncharacterized protein Tco025E_00299 [Trypanosoma conorhini]RNF27437.1 hypothetical protein Tco025E_00299 [Trypanosoma conorhini]
MSTGNPSSSVLSCCGGIEARRDALAAETPSTSKSPKGQAVAQASVPTACKLGDHEKSKRAAAVRWTSPPRNTAVVADAAVVRPREEKKWMEFQSEKRPPPTTSPSTVVKALVDTTTIAAGRDGPLSLESLLTESQQQLSELLWHRRRCRTLQAALDTSLERQKVLENDLLASSAEAHNAKEQHRAYVAATAEELRLAKAGLQAAENALRVMEDEVGGLRRENGRLRTLHQQAEADRAVWRRQHDGLEKEVARLRAERELVEGELTTCRARCGALEKLHAATEATVGAAAAVPHEEEARYTADGYEEEEDAATKDELRAAVHVLQRELERQCAEMDAVRKSAEAFRQDVRDLVAAAWKRLMALGERGAQLTSALAADGKRLQPLAEVHGEDAPDVDSAPAALTSLLRRLEQQWSGVAETAISTHRESQERLKELQDRFDAMKDTHAVELQAMKSATQAAADQTHRMELHYTQLFRAMERQSRTVLAAINTDVRRRKGAKTSHGREEGEEDKWNGTSTSDLSQEDNIEGQSEEHMRIISPDADALRPNAWSLGSKGYLTCEKILEPSNERAVYALVRRTHQATRSAARQLREARSTREALAKLQEEKQRQSVLIHEERVRHQATVRRLQTSLNSANETVSSLQTQLAAATRTSETEQHVLLRRVEAAERDVQAKLKQERQLQRQLREAHEKYEAVAREAAVRDGTIVELKTKLAARQELTREEQFDLNTLRGRCGDLVRMTDVLETQVRREVGNQDVLYALARKLCAALTVLTLRLNSIVAERVALWRAYEAQTADCRAAVQAIQEFIKKEEESGEETVLELKKMGQVLSLHHGRSLYAVVTVVMACGRMRHLGSSRSNSRRVKFIVSNEGGGRANRQNGGGVYTSRAQPPSWRMLTSNNILSLVESVPIVAAALRRQRGGTEMTFVQLPPLQTLLGVIAPHAGGGTAEPEEADALERTLALAELHADAEVNSPCFGAHLSRGLTSAGAGGPLRRRATPRVGFRDMPCRGTLAQTLHAVLGVMRGALAEVRRRMRQQELRIQVAEEEGQQLRRVAQEREEVAAGVAQKLREYERYVATSFVARDAYQQLQEQLRGAHDALQKERESRRTTEEANAALCQRELELTRTVQHLRGELRSLSMELAERPSHDLPQPQPHAGWRLPTPPLSPSRGGVVNAGRGSNVAQLYVPRSVRVTSSPHFTTCPTDLRPNNNNNNDDDEAGGQWDEVVRGVISDLGLRLAQAENPTP